MQSDARRSRRLRAAGVAVAALAIVAGAIYVKRRLGGGAPTYFAQAQSFIEDLDGAPLVAANWHGHFRPYVFRDGAFTPLLPAKVGRDLTRVDLYSPTVVAGHQIVMAAQTAGKPSFDLYLYDVDGGSLRNLTDSPNVDEGDFCVERSSGLLSYRSGARTQRFVRVGADGKVASIGGPVAVALDRCVWTSPQQVIGVRGRQPPYQLYTCNATAAGMACAPSDALSNVDHFIDFFVTADRHVGVIARKRGTPFRRPYYLTGGSLSDVNERDFPAGDVLEYDGANARLGLHSRYWTTLETDPDGAVTVFKMKKIGDRYLAIAADAQTSKTLAELRDGAWQLTTPPDAPSPERPARPFEIWLRSRKGNLHQAIYFGPLAPAKVVLWLHGGPKENVSARFNPYFHWLNRRGFGVLALNYPGSTGRGAAYENRFTPRDTTDALQAALDYLWSQHVETVVSWSISTGHRLQIELLAHRFGVSAMIDQAGGEPRYLKAEAARQHVPYLTIIGENDKDGADETVDVRYPGGHDITFEPDFRMVLAKVDSFLRDAPPWRYHAPPSLDGNLVLDPAHSGNAHDPNRDRGLTESELTFQLANTLLNGCLAGRPVILTRTGQPTLEKSPVRSVRERATLLDENPEAALLSLHFNASPPHKKGDNLTSAFVPFHPQEREQRLAEGLVSAMRDAGVAPKLTYDELAGVPLESLRPGVFARDLYLLRRSPHSRLHLRQGPPRVVFEVAYYDDDAENERLQERVLSPDGTWVRPRIAEIARAICPAVSAFFGDDDSR